LSQFLRNNGFTATEKELLAIIRRIDTDGDAKLSYSEFSEFIKSSDQRPIRDDFRRSHSVERTAGRNFGASFHASPLKRSEPYQSPLRSHSVYGGRAQTFSSPMRESSPLRDSRMSYRKDDSPLRESRMSPMRESRMSPLKETFSQ